MRLTRLEIKGFKSFRDKTVLEFPDKFMGIVGPNGSGKSNITEAICFVLGKSRGLRAANLSELIFNGGLGGTPSQKAVVALTLREDDGKKHKVTRIVEADGTSIYKINDKRATRAAILDIVGDSEYNILLQDDVTKVVEMKPKQRREIIDDLCGIGAYDEKRNKALRELDKVEERINQTTIILGQKQGYLTSLQIERDEALRYTNTQDDLHRAKATLLHKEITSLEKRDEKIMEETNAIESKRREDNLEISENKKVIEERRQELKDISKRMVELEEEKSGTRIAETRGDILRVQDRISHLEEKHSELSGEETEKKSQLEENTKEYGRLGEFLEQNSKKQETLEKHLKQEVEKGVDPALESEYDKVKNIVYESRSAINALSELAERIRQDRETLEIEKESLEAKIKEEVTTEQTTLRDYEKVKMEYQKTYTDFQTYKVRHKELEAQYQNAAEELAKHRMALNKRESMLEATLNASGGLRKAVREVMGIKKVIPGIHGPVMQLAQVKDEKYMPALQAAAGGRLQFIAVTTADDARKCIEHLREKNAGRATFLPLDRIRTRTTDKLPAGALGFARDYVEHPSKYEKVFKFVFGDTVVVSDIRAAQKIGVGKWRMVTLDGDLLELSGAMTGGSRPKTQDITISNVEELEKEIETIKKTIQKIQSETDTLRDEKSKIEDLVESLREKAAEGKHHLEGVELNNSIKNERREDHKNRLKDVISKIQKHDAELKAQAFESKKIEKKLSHEEKRLTELSKKRDKKRSTVVDDLREELNKAEVEKTRNEERLSNLKRTNFELRDRLERIKQIKLTLEDELKQKKSTLDELKKALIELEESHKTADAQVKELRLKRDAAEEDIQTLSARNGEVEAGMSTYSGRLSDYMVEKARISQKLEDLMGEFKRYEGVELLDKSVKALEEDVEKLSTKIDEFGSINLKAVETYDIVKKEYEDTTGKLDTLKKERQSIFDFMEKIETKKKETFMEAFEKVKENFEQIFTDLSDGKGTLIVDNPLNISEAGLLIKASPAGKKLMSLEAMSGGEKVLTSTAFLLALQQYKPAFFYIVDELDAALDHRNSMRLGNMLGESQSQFLMVTHNNNMLKHMNSAIGVSMKAGVSQIVGVRFEDYKNT